MQGQSDRRARFVCVVAVVHDGQQKTARGECTGTIGEQLLGEAGFGYDPLYLPTDFAGRSMAQLSMAEKNTISHRGRAFRAASALVLGQP